MHLVFDSDECVRCGACLEACPKTSGNGDYKIFNCNCEGHECFYACPRNAIVRISDNVFSIDVEKCDNCGDCSEVCPNNAILAGDTPQKCDMCYDREKPLCVEACPYGAIRLEMDGNEKQQVTKLMGWEKIRHGRVEEVLESDKLHSVVRIHKSGKAFLTKISGFSWDEARLISAVLNSFREASDEYDTALISQMIDDYCGNHSLVLNKSHHEKLLSQIEKEINGLSVLTDFINQDCLEEIAVVSPQQPVQVYHKKFGWLESDIIISNSEKLVDIVNRISRSLGRRITLQKPHINAHLDFGRIHAALPPVAFSGTCLTIRKFNRKPFSASDLVINNTASPEAMAFLWMAVHCDLNFLVAGNTGSGKTSTLNTLISMVPLDERIIIVEETPEISIPHKHQIRLTVSEGLDIRMHELVTDTLRMRPDRVVVGEVRSPSEAKALMNTMLAGQGKGSFATFHAQNSEEALIRLKSLGVNAVDLYALDLIIVQRRWTRYGATKQDVRRITEISAVEKDYKTEPRIQRLFEYSPEKDTLEKKTLDSDITRRIRLNFGLTQKQLEKELARRKKILEGGHAII